MYLILLLLLFAVVGYLLAQSRYSKTIDQAAGKVSRTSIGWSDKISDWWSGLFSRPSQLDSFKTWVDGPGDKLLPDDFKSWYSGLSDVEAKIFTQSLADYANGLDFNLDDLVDGSIDQQPMLKQVFVETITVYSDAYRKARQAHKEAQAKEAQQKAGAKAARKKSNRRETIPEAPETAPAV